MEYQSGAVRPVDSFSDGWSIIKNDYWMYVAMVVVLGIIVIVVSLILSAINSAISNVIAAALGMATSNSGDVARTSAVIFPQVIAQIVGFFVNIIVTTLSGVLICGLYKSMSRVANGARAEFGDLFGGFEYLQSCFIVAAVLSVVQFVIAIVTLVIGAAVGVSAIGLGIGGLINSDGTPNPAIFGGLFLVFLAFMGVYIIIMLIISALTTFVYPLIAERNLSGGQALMTSVKGGLANLGGMILLLIVGGLLIFAGAIPCGLGLPFVAPIYLAGLFAAYRSVFGSYGSSQQYNPPPPPNFGQQRGY
jgi:uncharacterized membrane protein